MGYWIGYCDDAIWEPSLTTGIYFMAQVKALENILKTQSGFIEEASDFININKEHLEAFLLKLRELYSSSDSEVLKLQLLPFFSILYEVFRRIAAEDVEALLISEEVRDLADKFSLKMVR